MHIKRLPIKFTADPSKVIMKFLDLRNPARFRAILERFGQLSEEEMSRLWQQTTGDFAHRHRNYKERLLSHFHKLERQLGANLQLSNREKLLLGTLASEEYSIQAAALFNPSIVPHPNQDGLSKGAIRFVMSLRAVGEGHISSIEFKQGVINSAGDITFEEEAQWRTPAQKVTSESFGRDWVKRRLAGVPGFKGDFLKKLPITFAKEQVLRLPQEKSRCLLLELMDDNYELLFDNEAALPESVIFPMATSEKMGMEDVRLVQFEDGKETRYFGTYTAYDGKKIQSKLLETSDFRQFEIHSLYGKEVEDKGIAFFPRKVNGKFAVISRQGGDSLSIMYSDDYLFWEEKQPLLSPSQPWELVQMGNCGSPIETPEGWLMLTHSVGPMRRYTLGVSLLDLDDPSRVIANLNRPLMTPLEDEREGYVPNVLYTCGWMQQNDNILIPYAMSDASCGFAMVSTEELLRNLNS